MYYLHNEKNKLLEVDIQMTELKREKHHKKMRAWAKI